MNLFLAQTLLFLSEHYTGTVKEIREAVWLISEVCQRLMWIGKWNQRMLALKWPEQLFAEAEWSSKKEAVGSSSDIAAFLSEPLFPVSLEQNTDLLLCAISEKLASWFCF